VPKWRTHEPDWFGARFAPIILHWLLVGQAKQFGSCADPYSQSDRQLG